MEGVGARLGRSSSRYGTTTVFTGPVRKWKKNWVPITPPSSSNNSNSNQNHLQPSCSSSPNGGSISHLRLFKWTPLSHKENFNSSNDNSIGNRGSSREEPGSEMPPRKKFKYIPIVVLEEQKRQAEDDENDDDEDQASKPDINGSPMEENWATEETQTAPGRHDLNESLDLSLG